MSNINDSQGIKMKTGKSFLEKFEAYLLQEKLLRKKDKILVGISGGADSTALLLALHHLRSKYDFQILAACVNYNLRDKENAEEIKFIKELCFSRNISILINNFNPAGKKINENELRNYRMKWFKNLMKSYKMSTIALGHNKGDQAETIMYRLLRGSLLTGLSGIRPRSGKTIHPLLPFTRTEITTYLKQEGVGWCEDSSNQSMQFTRNKLRNHLFPWVEENINPRVQEKLAELSPFLREADELLYDSAMKRLRHIMEEKHNGELQVDIEGLMRMPSILRFYAYRQLMIIATGNDKDFYQSNFEELDKALQAEGNRSIQMPQKIFFFKEYGVLKLYKLGCHEEEAEYEEQRELPGLRNRFAFSGWRITMKKLKKLPEKRDLLLDKKIAYLDFDKLEWPLVVRHREPGDKFQPTGMTNHKKLKDYFIDIKLPQKQRKETLVFVDQSKIIWIGGLRIDQRVAITEETSSILMLKIEKIRRRKARPAERKKKG